MASLTNKIALVTGASRGIGRATASALADAGAHVLVHYARSAQDAESLVAGVRSKGGRADAIRADLGTADGATLLAREVRQIVNERLDVLVCNAGISKAATIAGHTVEDFDILFATNVRGPFFLVQQLLHCLGEGSNIIVISSIGAHAVVGKPGLDNPSILAYAATKGALETLVKNWAAILGPKGIRVNAVAAGAVGSLAGQLATIARARAVGIAGGPNKCAFVKEELGFDIAVDYKATGFPEALAMACPDGVDVYFENVGGAVWQAVLPLLNQFARVPVSGIIAHYDGGYSSGDDLLPEAMRQVIAKRLTLRGFINYDFAAEYFLDFVRDVSEWLKEGRIHYREHIVDELENARRPSSACSTVRIWAKLWSACHSV